MSKPSTLSKAELAQSRTPVELLNWVEKVRAELGSTLEHRKYARSGTICPKKFYEEILPLALFAWKEFGNRDDVQVTPNLGNENFDGIIELSINKRIYVEITCAKNGYDDALRMEVLNEVGHVNALASINVVGTRYARNRRIAVSDDAVNHTDVISEHLELVKRCLIGKSNATYGRDYILLLVVDDYLPFRCKRDVEVLKTFVYSELPRIPLNFGRIVVLGISGQLCLNFDLSADLHMWL